MKKSPDGARLRCLAEQGGRRRHTASARASLPLFAAPDPGVRLLPYMHLTAHIENDLPLYPQTVYNRRMDIIYQLQGVEFEWDEERAATLPIMV